MNPLVSGVFFVAEAGVKCLEMVCVVSPFIGMGGSDGLCPCPWPGGCADAVITPDCNPNKTTKAIAGKKDMHFLFIADFFCNNDCCF
jgi:hypothetical protein